MKYLVLIASLLAAAGAMPFEFLQDDDGVQYYAISVGRVKRQTKIDISQSGVGAAHQGTFLNTNAHRLDGTDYANKNYASHGIRPDQFGGRLDYSHRASGSGVFVAADHFHRFGTNVNAGLKYNVYQGRNFGVDVGGQYSRHYGGIFGTLRPDSALYMKMYGHY